MKDQAHTCPVSPVWLQELLNPFMQERVYSQIALECSAGHRKNFMLQPPWPSLQPLQKVHALDRSDTGIVFM